MQIVNPQVNQISISCPRLPLTVYREIAAHLQQVEGITVTLLPQLSKQFDYYQSQIGGLKIEFAAPANLSNRTRVEQILAYYADLFGNWHPYQISE